MRVILLCCALLVAVIPLTGNDYGRTRCCHGCGSYYCNRDNCGNACSASPCRGCWKSCMRGESEERQLRTPVD